MKYYGHNVFVHSVEWSFSHHIFKISITFFGIKVAQYEYKYTWGEYEKIIKSNDNYIFTFGNANYIWLRR